MSKSREGKKLGRTTAHRFALLNSLATSLFRNEQIKTTEAKAKELRRYVDNIITTAKKGGLPNIRRVKRKIRVRFFGLVDRHRNRLNRNQRA